MLRFSIRRAPQPNTQLTRRQQRQTQLAVRERIEWRCWRSGAAPCSAEVTHFAPRQLRPQVLAARRNASRAEAKSCTRTETPQRRSANAPREQKHRKRGSQNPRERNQAERAETQTPRENRNAERAEAPTRNAGGNDESRNGKATKPTTSTTLRAAAERQAHPPPEAQRPKRGTSEGNGAVGGRVQRLVRQFVGDFRANFGRENTKLTNQRFAHET